MTGIYCIENTINGMKYVGKSEDIISRWRVHRHHLRGNTHINIHLQRAWNKYGEDAFKFYVIEQTDAEHLNDAEIEWIKKLDTFKHGYNRTEGGEGQSGRKLTDEQKRHLSEINRGENNPNYGLKRSLETRQRMSEALRHPRKPHTDEHKEKISQSARNVDHSSQRRPVIWIETGEIFESIMDASNKTGFGFQSICKVCRGKLKTIHKQHFSYIGG